MSGRTPRPFSVVFEKTFEKGVKSELIETAWSDALPENASDTQALKKLHQDVTNYQAGKVAMGLMKHQSALKSILLACVPAAGQMQEAIDLKKRIAEIAKLLRSVQKECDQIPSELTKLTDVIKNNLSWLQNEYPAQHNELYEDLNKAERAFIDNPDANPALKDAFLNDQLHGELLDQYPNLNAYAHLIQQEAEAYQRLDQAVMKANEVVFKAVGLGRFQSRLEKLNVEFENAVKKDALTGTAAVVGAAFPIVGPLVAKGCDVLASAGLAAHERMKDSERRQQKKAATKADRKASQAMGVEMTTYQEALHDEKYQQFAKDILGDDEFQQLDVAVQYARNKLTPVTEAMGGRRGAFSPVQPLAATFSSLVHQRARTQEIKLPIGRQRSGENVSTRPPVAVVFGKNHGGDKANAMGESKAMDEVSSDTDDETGPSDESEFNDSEQIFP